jgi:hypothetical protein
LPAAVPLPQNQEYRAMISKQVAHCWPMDGTSNPYREPPVPMVRDVQTDANGNIVSIAPRRVEPDHMPSVKMVVLVDGGGNVRDIALDPESRAYFQQVPAFRTFAFNAMKAVTDCSPLHGLPEPADAQKGWALPIEIPPDMVNVAQF